MKRGPALLVAVLVALTELACGSLPLIDPDWSSQAGRHVLHLRWIKNLAPGYPNFQIQQMVEENDRFNPVETTAAGFDTDKQRVFVGAATGGLYCLDIASGDTIWRFGLMDPVGSTPLYDSQRKRVYFGADDGNMYALHARSGRKLWSVNTGSEIQRTITIHEDTLYFANADNTVLAVDPLGGEIIWRFRKPPMEGFSASGYSDIVFDENRLIAAFADGTISALNPVSGAEIWSADLASEIVAASRSGEVNLIDADATPVIIDGTIVAASVDGGLFGLNVLNGNVVWIRPDLNKVTGLAKANGMAFAVRTGVGLVAVDPGTGKVLWTSHFGVGVMQDPLVYEDLLLISDSEVGLFLVSSATGKVLQRVDPKSGFFARPSGYGGFMLIMGNRSTLYAMTIN